MTKRPDPTPSTLNEPQTEYVRNAPRIAWRFERLSRKALMEQARKPMSMPVLRKRVESNPFAEIAYAELLNTSVTGLRARMRKRAPLEPAEAERVLLYEQTMARGVEVFGEQQKFERWLGLRIPALENQRPSDLMTTSTGIQLVADELEAISYGTFT